MATVSNDVAEAIVNEYQDILNLLTDNVEITRLNAPQGSICLWQFVVKARTHYLVEEDDTVPKETDSMTFWLDVKDGYPKVKPYVYYAPNHRLASVNVFRNGAQCIDEWKYDEAHAGNNSSLLTTVEKTIKDIIHDPTVSRFDSMANRSMAQWQKENTENHRFPTCSLSHVFRMEGASKEAVPSLPKKPTGGNAAPPLPVKRGGA